MSGIVDSTVGRWPVTALYLGDRLVWERKVPDYRLTIPFTIPITMVQAPDTE